MIEDKTKMAAISSEGECIKRRSTRDTDHFSDDFQSIDYQLNESKQRFSADNHIKNTEENFESPYCRVCLQCEESGNRLVKSCNCRDLIHEKCLLEWIEHRIQINDYTKNMSCEICKGAYNVEFQQVYSFTCQISKEKYSKYRKSFVQSLLGFLVFLGLSILSAIFLIKIYWSNGFQANIEEALKLPKNTIVAILLMFLIFMGSFTIGLGYKLILQYCYGTSIRIKANSSANESE